ncbi:unnamed protein product [Phyllotreta striolata]|uniref:Uncharacterized protein n=1 Tax=Phyllotreta striolata TaxID=444603 RepID=A0A9N9XTW7_PHYSR|nr:unnamed protein product [Phyllotreta striolata]
MIDEFKVGNGFDCVKPSYESSRTSPAQQSRAITIRPSTSNRYNQFDRRKRSSHRSRDGTESLKRNAEKSPVNRAVAKKYPTSESETHFSHTHTHTHKPTTHTARPISAQNVLFRTDNIIKDNREAEGRNETARMIEPWISRTARGESKDGRSKEDKKKKS